MPCQIRPDIVVSHHLRRVNGGICYNSPVRWQSLHSWNVSPQEAKEIQGRLASRVSRQNALAGEPRYVAGLDLSPEDREGKVRGAVVVMQYPELRVVEVKWAELKSSFPYVPGLLAFREMPPLLAALEKLVLTPDLFLVDGQGIAHPRRFGIASHLGLLLDAPTIGCAKSILRGKHGPLPDPAGSWVPLLDGEEVVGAAVRTRQGVTPIYVSIGHKVDLAGAIAWTTACCRGFRLPEPTRLAHQAAAGRLLPQEPTAR